MNKARRKQIDAINTKAIREKADELRLLIEDARNEFDAVKDEEEEAYENLPESLQQAEQGEKMQAIVEGLDAIVEGLDEATEAIETLTGALDTFENDIDLN